MSDNVFYVVWYHLLKNLKCFLQSFDDKISNNVLKLDLYQYLWKVLQTLWYESHSLCHYTILISKLGTMFSILSSAKCRGCFKRFKNYLWPMASTTAPVDPSLHHFVKYTRSYLINSASNVGLYMIDQGLLVYQHRTEIWRSHTKLSPKVWNHTNEVANSQVYNLR